MTDTLFDVVLAVGQLLGGMAYGTTTASGSSSTLIDTSRIENDDYWTRGTVLIVTSSAGPAGEFGIVTNWVNGTSTLTFQTLTASVASGDDYAIIPPRWSLEMIKNKINLVLRRINIPQIDTTSLDTADNQTEYTLPAAIPASSLRRVWLETNEDSNDNRWMEIRDWRVYAKDTGTQDVLVLPQFSSGWDIRLDYVVPHPTLFDCDDEISEAIHLNRIIYHVAELCMIENLISGESHQNLKELTNYFRDLAQEAEATHPVIVPAMNSYIRTYGVGKSEYTGEVGKVRL